MMMQYGNAAWGLRELPLEKQLELTKAMKLDLLELSIANYHKDPLQLDSGKKQIEAVKEQFSRYGVRPDCAATGNDFTSDSADAVRASLENTKRVIDIAAEVGVKILRIFAGFSSDSVMVGERFERMLETLRLAAAHTQGTGVRLAIETHGGGEQVGGAFYYSNTATTRIDLMYKILNNLPADRIGMNYDPANLAATGDSAPERWFELFKDRIILVHLKDFRDAGNGVVPVACGEGRLDWRKLTTALTAYDGPALIEYELPADIEDGLRRSLRFMKQNNL